LPDALEVRVRELRQVDERKLAHLCQLAGGLGIVIASLHMFASVVHRSSRHLAFLESRFFQFFGSISYSFYLWHALVMSAVKRIVTPYLVPHVGVAVGFVVFIVASGAIATVISWASWRFFEVRLARAAQRFVVDVNELQSSRAT
jgi:peptidoglycan/LPS O-acetylase OafA/YrhL